MTEVKRMTWEDFETHCVLATRPNATRCGVGLLLAELEPDARRKVETALGNPDISSMAIAETLRKKIGEAAPRQYTIARHRRGECSCR